jgi:hypothetical protein
VLLLRSDLDFSSWHPASRPHAARGDLSGRDRNSGEYPAAAHHDGDPIRHASQISRELKPAMAELRVVVDTLETLVAADLWPLPTYRDLLFLK